nr:glutathione S-transferase 1-like [Cherax quadricarinatus]
MPVDLHYMLPSAPCRASMLTAKAVGLELNLKHLDVFASEQMKPEFLAINPEHVIPTLVDGDFVLWESRVICTYLASKYGKDDSLYPSDLQTRAKVDRLLYFDMGTLFHRFGEYVFPVLFRSQKEFNPAKLERLHEALGWLNDLLDGHDWAAGNTLTVADHSLAATVETFLAADIDLSKYNNILSWLKRCNTKMAGYKEINLKGSEEFKKMFKSRSSS